MSFKVSKWALDSPSSKAVSKSDRHVQVGKLAALGYQTVTSKKSESKGSNMQAHELQQLKQSKAWDLAKSPVKSIPMNLFMMWMAGASVHIFSLMIVGMTSMGPLTGISNAQQAFTPLSAGGNVDVFWPKVVYIALQIACLGVPLYQAYRLGLWPTTADFLWNEAHDPRFELSIGGFSI
eukprot:CFRG6804T1